MKHIYKYLTIGIALLAGSFAVHAQNDGVNYNAAGGVSTAKNVEGPDKDGYYTISLETFATGTSALTETGIPTDIVLVLDVSGSMSDNMTTYSYTARTSQAYTYNSYGSNTYYYLYTDGNYYAVSRTYEYDGSGSQSSWSNYYTRLSFTVDNTTYYLSGDTVTTTPPTDVKGNTNTIWTGVLYSRSSSTQSKLNALKNAVTAFVGEVHTNALYDTDGNLRGTPLTNRISIVKFANDVYYGSESSITAGNNRGTIGSDSGYGNGRTWDNCNYTEVVIGFTDVSTAAGQTSVNNAVTALVAGGGTAAHYGMKKAEYLMADIDEDRESTKTVVMFTDGMPGMSGDWDQYAANFANSAIDTAKDLKNDYDAIVFTVGVFSDLGSDATNVNTYMSYTSSNYPNAENMTTPGADGNADGGYYQNASGSDLTAIFKDIAGQAAAPAASIGAQTQVRDVVSNSFVLPEGASASDVTVASWDIKEDGSGWENETVLPSSGENKKIDISIAPVVGDDGVSRDQIVIEGFDYSADDTKNDDGFTVTAGNWVGQRYFSKTDIRWKGKKLVITFKVRANGEATGGAGTNTNHPSSGVYVYNPDTQTYTNVNHYPVPHTTLPLILKIVKDGLRHGESATFEIHRADPLKDDDGNIVYNAIGKPMPDMDTDGNWSKVILTNKEADGDPVTKVLMALDPNYVYSIIEDDWGWSYELTGESSTLTTSDVEVNPFIFHNKLKGNTVKHAEAVAINHFSTVEEGTSSNDAWTESYKSSKVESFTTGTNSGNNNGNNSGTNNGNN